MNPSRVRNSLLVLLLAAPLPALAASTPLDELLAERGYGLGSEVETLADFDLSGRSALDSRHLLLPATDGRTFLVTLTDRCFGLAGNPIVPRTRTHHVLAPGDKLQPRHEGRNVDVCEVASIHALESR